MSRRLLLALVATTSALTSSAGASATHGIRASFTAAPLVGGGVPDIGYLSLCESGVPRFAWDSCAGSNVAASLAPVRRASGRAKLAGRATEPGSGSKVGAFATGGTEAGPLPPATQPKSGAAPADTDPQGDSVQLSEASVGSGSGGTVTCSPPFDVSVSPGSDIGGCVVVNLTDSVTGSFAPANNSLITDWFDSCGNVVHNSSTIGWHTVGFTTLEDGTLLFDAPWIVPTSGFCFGGDWRLQFTFAETFTDGQTLSDTVSHLFPVSAPPPPPPPSSASGVGSGDATVHDPTPCAGDPVNCTSGNFSEIYTDTAVPGRGPSLALTRTYNSLSASTRGIFGYGWTSPYEAHLTTNSDGSVTVTEADGSGVTATAVGSGYSIPAWADSTLTHNGDGTWTFVRQQTTTDTFDSSGRLTSITDRNGYSTTLVYNAAGQLSTVTDPAGRTLTFTFGSNGLVSQIADPLNQTTTYGYDDADNLTSVTDPLLRLTGFGYDANHLLLTVTDPNQGLTTNVYDGSGRVTQQTDPANLVTHFAYAGDNYSAGGGTTTITDPHGSITVENFANGLMTSKTVASGTSIAGTWNYQYDPNTFGTTSVADPNNHATTATYDAFGNVLSRTDALNHSTTYTYNSLNEPLTVADPAGIETSFTYDTNGNVLTKTVTGAGGSPVEATTYSYTDGFAGDITEITDPVGHVTDYSYDSQGDVASLTTHPASGVNDTTAFVYDALGRKICEASANATAAGVQCPTPGQQRVADTTTWSYDADSEVIAQTDPLGNTTSYSFDSNGNQTQLTDAVGNVTKASFDADSRETDVTTGFGTSGASTTSYNYDIAPGNAGCASSVTGASYCTTMTDPSGQLTVEYFNVRNEKIEETQPSAGTSSSTYDPAGNVATHTTAAGAAAYGYDAVDELTSETFSNAASGFAAVANIAYSYDADGRRNSMTDGTGTSTYAYDSLERLQSVSNGAGSSATYGYDLDNEVTSIAYPGTGHTITQTWDTAGRESTVNDWLSHTTNFAYDDDGNLLSAAYPNGTTVTSAYDDGDNLLSTKQALNTNLSNPFADFAYSYNADLQVKTESDTGTPAPNSQNFAYDPLTRLASSSSLVYGYDTSGDPTQLGPLTQSFSGAHQIGAQAGPITRVGTSSAGDSGTGSTLTLALPAGTAANDQILLAVSLPGSQSIKSTPSGYTAVGTVSSGTGASNVKLAIYRRTAVAGDSSVTVTFSKTFAKSATLVVYRGVNPATPIDVSSTGTTGSGASVNTPSLTTTKASDELVILEGAESSSAGSWTAPTQMTTRVSQAGGPTTTGSIADQALATAGVTGPRTASFSVTGSLAAELIALQPTSAAYTYDALGDRTTVVTPSGTTSLNYDQLGRMTAFGSTTYAYDGDGLRASKKIGHQTTSELWASLTEQTPPSLLVDGSVDYVYGPEGLPLEQINGSTVIYYLHDQIGSTRVLTDAGGATAGTYTFSAFGGVAGSSGSVSTPFGFGGGYTDAESGEIYLQHRYYDPATAQFTSVDPFVDTTAAPYAYANDDPTDMIDPTGLFCLLGHNSNGSCRGSSALHTAGSAAVGVGSYVYHHPYQDIEYAAAGVCILASDGVCLQAVGAAAAINTGHNAAVAFGNGFSGCALKQFGRSEALTIGENVAGGGAGLIKGGLGAAGQLEGALPQSLAGNAALNTPFSATSATVTTLEPGIDRNAPGAGGCGCS